MSYARQVRFAVASAWATLGITGRWRAEPSWIDRLGRAIGAAWIGVTVISWFRYDLP